MVLQVHQILKNMRARLCLAVVVVCLALAAMPGLADNEAHFTIPPQTLAGALRDFALQSGFNIMADATLADGKRTPGLTTTAKPETVLRLLLADSGLDYFRDGKTIVIISAAAAVQPETQIDTSVPAPVSGDVEDKNSQRSAPGEIIATADRNGRGDSPGVLGIFTIGS